MPNHITNNVTIVACSEKRRSEVMLSILTDKGVFDFNKIIPMPKILKDTQCPNTKNPDKCEKQTGFQDWYHWSYANWGTKWNAYDQLFEYVGVNHRRWHLSVRGGLFKKSKYRCYPNRINKKRYKKFVAENGAQESVEFQTAWAMPNYIFIAMSEKYPDVEFVVKFADEDLGCNCGIVSYRNGKPFSEKIANDYRDQSIEDRRYWREFAFNLCHPNEDPKDWDFDSNWNYEGE